MTDTKSLAEIRHLLVIAAQKDYDDRIAKLEKKLVEEEDNLFGL